jgi:hypothetical protein
MARAAGVGDGKLGDGWGTTKVGGFVLFNRCYDTTVETKSLLSCPTLSVRGSGFIGVTAAHWIATRGSVLVAVGRIATVAAVVARIHVETVRPTVI